ncbi:MAG: hypothetical protein ACL7BU_04375 [Candidatus Phlomobacter fragariae]
MSILTQTLDRPIAFQRVFVRLGIGITGALLLSQLIYWHNRTKKAWFYKTRTEIEDETGLTRTEQETARKRLVKIGVLEEKLMSTPAKMHFRINDIVLQEALNKVCTDEHRETDNDTVSKNVSLAPTSMQDFCQQAGKVVHQLVGANPANIINRDYTEITIDPSIISLTKKSKVFDPNSVELPSWLSKSIWNSWWQYRKEINKPIKSQMTVNQTIKLLVRCRERGHQPEDIINTSIANGWQGLFEPKDIQSKKSRYRFKEIDKTDVFITDDF